MKELRISSQFPTAEFARLSTKLKTTKCDKFQPFLNSKKDAVKIEKYAQKFSDLVSYFETHVKA